MAYDDEYYYCTSCEVEECHDCGHGFYASDDEEFEVECPCCGSTDVQV